MIRSIQGVLLIRTWDYGQVQHTQLTYWCIGCEAGHTIEVEDEKAWTWDGNVNKPTFSPSILSMPREKLNESGKLLVQSNRGSELTDEHRIKTPRCHCFVKNGRIEYLSDSEHSLAGQTVDMVPLPDRYREFLED